MYFTKELKAADIILTHGIEGANEAALLVGMQTALAMVLVHLDGDNETKLKAVHDAGLNNVADFCPITGQTVIYEEGAGVTAALDIVDGKCVDVETKNLHIPMWMQGGEIKSIFAGKSPYAEVRKIILREQKIEHARIMSLIEEKG